MYLLSTAYLPPVQYVSKFILSNVLIEQYENYIKQSYRNRCCILGANGILSLTIPIVKNHGEKMPIRDVKIDYDLSWQKTHLKSIESAYKNSPFYDYYMDDITPFYTKKFNFLFDFNQELLLKILMLTGISNKPELTTEYEKMPLNATDSRNTISPKSGKQITDKYFTSIPYYQVFEDKFNFIPNLSIIDLLFNEGPQAKAILEKSIKKGEL